MGDAMEKCGAGEQAPFMYKTIYYTSLYNMEAVLHYPRLDTVLMVEDAIRKSGEYPSKRQLWMGLPKKMMYQTFNLIIDYLEDSGKIAIDKDGAVLWTHNPRLLETSVKAR